MMGWSLIIMHICYLHINLWAEELEAEFLLYIIAPIPWSLKLEPCCWGTGVISTMVTGIHTYWNKKNKKRSFATANFIE